MAEADVPQERSSKPQAQATAGKPTAETSSAQVERTMPLPPRRPWSTGGRLSVLGGWMDGVTSPLAGRLRLISTPSTACPKALLQSPADSAADPVSVRTGLINNLGAALPPSVSACLKPRYNTTPVLAISWPPTLSVLASSSCSKYSHRRSPDPRRTAGGFDRFPIQDDELLHALIVCLLLVRAVLYLVAEIAAVD